MPPSSAGTRFSKKEDPANSSNFSRFSRGVASILWRELPLGKEKELLPEPLPFSEKAARLWFKYADSVEAQLGPNGDREMIKGLANKLPEHAARIGAILTLIDNIEPKEIDYYYLGHGIELSEYYANEATRIYLSSQS